MCSINGTLERLKVHFSLIMIMKLFIHLKETLAKITAERFRRLFEADVSANMAAKLNKRVHDGRSC